MNILRSISQIESIRNTWEEMQWHPNSDIDLFLMLLKERPEVSGPYVIMSGENTHEAMVVGRIEFTQFDVHLGYKKLMSRPVKQLSIIHGGLLGNHTKANSEIAISAIIDALRRGEADCVFFNHIPIASALIDQALKRPFFLCRDLSPRRNIHWKVNLTGSFSNFLQRISSKTRSELRRTERAFEKAVSGRVSFRKYCSADEIDLLASEAECVAKTGYQRGLEAGFRDNQETRERLKLMAVRGLLRAYILYAGNVPCAYWMGTKYRQTVFLNSTGYNPEFRKYEVGTILFLKMIEELCQDECIKGIDFGIGHASYKERFSDEQWEDCSMYMFAPTARGVTLNVSRAVSSRLSVWAEVLLRRIGFRDRVKRIWRSRLAGLCLRS